MIDLPSVCWTPAIDADAWTRDEPQRDKCAIGARHARLAESVMEPRNSSGAGATWMAFMVMAFVVVGLTGLFASFAVSVPLERALARDAALDAALAAAAGPDPQTSIEALRPRLAESASALLPVDGNMAARIGLEREAMRNRLTAEASEVANRVRWLVCVITIMGAAFGVAILRVGRQG